jgi:myosin heavy subunit
VLRNALYPVNPADKLGVEDNCALLHLHEPGLLHNLRYRYKTDAIYTYTAFILIAVNPYQRLAELYSKLEPYRGKAIGVMPPHVYAIGDRAHRLMKAERHSQTCVISGESGSGKTESAKYIMTYLAFVGKPADDQSSPSAIDHGTLVIQSNPVLEATGNAKTLRNNNSSRFGKFIEMHFDSRGVLMGAAIQVYLLEKSRLVHQDAMERNYHVFYQARPAV